MSFFRKVIGEQRGGSRVTMGPGFVFPVCDICGALLVDQELHDNFHAALTPGDTE